MLKTKRAFFILIAILVILDIAAAFWYVAGRLNNDDNDNPFSVEADSLAVPDSTIVGETAPDKFEITEKSAYFVSVNPVSASKPGTYWTSTKRYKGRIPVSVNGSNAIDELLKEIEHRAFGFGTGSVNTCATAFLKSPKFNTNSPVDFKSVAKEPHVNEVYGNVSTIKIYPTFTSDYLLVMAIDKQDYDGYTRTQRMSFVIYNRKKHQVLEKDNIFNKSLEPKILALINSHIDELNLGGTLNLRHAASLPPEITLGRKGILFVFDSGSIADIDKGIIDVFLPYSRLKPYLTTEFNAIVNANNGFWDYDPIKFDD
ncbi:MAG: hypothetical protein J5523_00880 [Muribaculaceae bacterium]|nr:hypothetical protein [Muribaculaceae bacterium]